MPQDHAAVLPGRDPTASRTGVDFEVEGLLDGVHGSARMARERLLRELLEDGLTLQELRDAMAKDRIALVPSEPLLQNGDRHAHQPDAHHPRARDRGCPPSAGLERDPPLPGPGHRIRPRRPIRAGAGGALANLTTGRGRPVDRRPALPALGRAAATIGSRRDAPPQGCHRGGSHCSTTTSPHTSSSSVGGTRSRIAIYGCTHLAHEAGVVCCAERAWSPPPCVPSP